MAVNVTYLILLAIGSSGLATEHVPLLRGKTLSLDCTVENSSQNIQDDIVWTKNGKLLSNWTRKQIYRQEQVQLDDSGVYICNVTGRLQQRFDVIVGDVPVARGLDISLNCSADTVNQSMHTYIEWSKNGKILENQTEPTYTLFTVQFTDGGVYTCNNSGTEKKYAVVVGDIPTDFPKPECLTSPNTTIRCFSQSMNIQWNEMCISFNGYQQPFGPTTHLTSDCEQEKMQLNVSIDLDNYYDYAKYKVKTTVRNDFGESSSSKDYFLPQKVIPDPPVNVKLETTGVESIVASFDIPDSWKPASRLNFYFRYTVVDEAIDEISERAAPRNSKTVKFNIDPEHKLPHFSVVCITVYIRFAHEWFGGWSNPSQEICNYTEAAAPSESPQNVTLVTDELKGAHGVVLQWLPPPKGSRNGIIESYELVITEISTGNEVLNVTLPGNETTWNDTSAPLNPYREYRIELAASTSRGRSPYYEYPLMARKSRNIVLLIVIGVICLAGLVILVGGGWILERKVHSRHLPEPYLIPESHMEFLLSRKCPPPQQKEIFDDLKCPVGDIRNEAKPEKDNNTDDESQTKRSATSHEASPLVDDGYIRRNSRDLACEEEIGSFSGTHPEVTDLTPNQTLFVFTFPDTEPSKPYDSADGMSYQTKQSSSEGPVHGSDDCQYITEDDLRMKVGSSDEPSYENYSSPFEVKVLEIMTKLNAKFKV